MNNKVVSIPAGLYMSVADYAKAKGLSRFGVHKQIARKKISAIQVGRIYLIWVGNRPPISEEDRKKPFDPKLFKNMLL